MIDMVNIKSKVMKQMFYYKKIKQKINNLFYKYTDYLKIVLKCFEYFFVESFRILVWVDSLFISFRFLFCCVVDIFGQMFYNDAFLFS